MHVRDLSSDAKRQPSVWALRHYLLSITHEEGANNAASANTQILPPTTLSFFLYKTKNPRQKNPPASTSFLKPCGVSPNPSFTPFVPPMTMTGAPDVPSPSSRSDRPSPPAEGEGLCNGGDYASVKKPAWNVLPSSGGSEVGPVMGADSWPALPASASRPSIKPSSSDALKKLSSDSAEASAVQSHGAPAIQKPSRYDHLSNANHRRGEIRQSCRKSEVPPANADKSRQGFSSETLTSKENDNPAALQHRAADVSLPQLQSGSNHRRVRDSGVHRGGSFSGAGGGFPHWRVQSNRRDYGRGSYGWTGLHGFNPRYWHAQVPLEQQPLQSQQFMRPLPLLAPPPPPPPQPRSLPMASYLAMHLHSQTFMSPICYEPQSVYSPPPPFHMETYRSMPMVAHQVQIPPALPQTVEFSLIDYHRSALVNQIEYYFCDENLENDSYLKDHMNEQGWVPVSLIANFNRIKKLTDDTQYILDALRECSKLVQVQGDKIRKRVDWIKWLPSKKSDPYGSASKTHPPQPANHDSIAEKDFRQLRPHPPHPHEMRQSMSEPLSSVSVNFNTQTQESLTDSRKTSQGGKGLGQSSCSSQQERFSKHKNMII